MSDLIPRKDGGATIQCRSKDSNFIDHVTIHDGPRLTAEQFATVGEMWGSVGCDWEFDAEAQRMAPCIALEKWRELKEAEWEYTGETK